MQSYIIYQGFNTRIKVIQETVLRSSAVMHQSHHGITILSCDRLRVMVDNCLNTRCEYELEQAKN